jgi:hypothetical protein
VRTQVLPHGTPTFESPRLEVFCIGGLVTAGVNPALSSTRNSLGARVRTQVLPRGTPTFESPRLEVFCIGRLVTAGVNPAWSSTRNSLGGAGEDAGPPPRNSHL